MHVYDFDGTIYRGDCTVDFFWFMLRQQPRLLRYVPKQLWGCVLYALGRIHKTQLKEYFFCFLAAVDALPYVEQFWKVYRHKIYAWYLAAQQAEDVVISASPDFLVEPICRQLGIRHVIASKVDIRSGRFTGENCRGEEKVRRFTAVFGEVPIARFYSDSCSDLPLARLADTAFLVKKGTPVLWDRGGPDCE